MSSGKPGRRGGLRAFVHPRTSEIHLVPARGSLTLCGRASVAELRPATEQPAARGALRWCPECYDRGPPETVVDVTLKFGLLVPPSRE